MKRFSTLFVGQVLYDLPEVASTNEYAVSLLSKSKPPEGTVISTFCQTHGKGQIGSSWESEPFKNISLSLILYPVFLPPQQQFFLCMAMSLAVLDFVKMLLPGAEASIKWPNDIYVGDLKTAGILIQNTIGGNCLQTSVVGIGINVNQTLFLTNPPNPTSLCLEAGQFFELEQAVSLLCTCLEQRYLQLKAGKSDQIKADYHQGLFRLGVWSPFSGADGKKFDGLVKGVGEFGRLMVEVDGEGLKTFDLKEVKFLGLGNS